VQQKPAYVALVLVLCAAMVAALAAPLQAQDNTATPPIPTAAELDQLLAPVALYPDTLLAQITTASTDPQEILDVDNWIAAHPELTGTALTDAAQAQGFDPAFIALVNFPQIIHMMAENVDDYAAIGEAFTADQQSVSASIQRLRGQAYSAGNLRSNDQLKVEVQQQAAQPIYVIQPASPQIVYVPQYDPTVVYVSPAPGPVVTTSLITFGAGIAIGALLVDNSPWGWGGWGWNWNSHVVYYNRGPWGGWGNPYRPPYYWYRPRPVRYASRPGYGGNWRYRPPNYRPPYRGGNRPVRTQPWGPTNRPNGYRPSRPNNGGNNGGNHGRPPSSRPNPGTPNRPNNPSTKPNPGTPNRPNNPNTKPNTRPGGSRPQPGAPTANPGGSQPKPGTGRPSRDTSKPGTTRPSPDTSQPKPGTTRPQHGGSRPSPGTSNPGTRPAPGASQPKPGTGRPSQGSPQSQPSSNRQRSPQQSRPAPQRQGSNSGSNSKPSSSQQPR
jgi:hypothetical protein